MAVPLELEGQLDESKEWEVEVSIVQSHICERNIRAVLLPRPPASAEQRRRQHRCGRRGRRGDVP